jgi:hypothetical protein
VPTLSNPVHEGKRVAEAAAAAGTPLRLLGGVAVALQCPSSQEPPLSRSYADIDFGTVAAARDAAVGLIAGLGYEEDREFNTLHGHRRLIFWDEEKHRHLDVFVEEADLCHRIPLHERIAAIPLTLPLADLVVLKLQVVETNEKDYLDICALFADHDLSEDESGINVAYIANLTASDWGLWRTLGMVAERAERFARDLSGFERAGVVAERLERLRQKLDSAPKTRGWKMRARIGERKRWYELPEEVH